MKLPIILLSLFLLCAVLGCTEPKRAEPLVPKVVDEQIKSPVLDTIPPTFDHIEKRWWKTPVDSCTLPIDINGVYIDRVYPKEELIRIFGEPSESIDRWESTGEWRAYYRTGYHTLYAIYCSREWGIYDFTLHDSRFSIYNGFISVGKSIRLFDALGCGKLAGGSGEYRFYTNNDPRVNVFYIWTDKRGIIELISFSSYDIGVPDEDSIP